MDRVAGGMAVLHVIEWPLALVSTAGHLLADQHMSGWRRGSARRGSRPDETGLTVDLNRG